MTQVSLWGTNVSAQLKEIINRYSISTILLVRGNKSYEISGAKKIIEHAIEGKKIEIFDYYGFQENPKIEDVEIGIGLIYNKSIDLIIGIGGGSVLDMSKLIRFFYSYEKDHHFEHFIKKRNIIPLIAIPTTSGTGSESTHFAVVYKNKIKYSVAHKNVLPNIAIIDPIFTYNISKYLTACAGFDALAQAIEAYWNINATAESDEYAIKAINLLWKNLPETVTNPTKDLRIIVSEGSYWAGKSINITKTTAPHAFSYPFTTYYGYPHGHAVALTFPFFMMFNYGNCISQIKLDANIHHEKMKYLYDLLSISSPDIAASNMFEYITKLGLTYALPNAFNKHLIIDNIDLQRMGNNPVDLDPKDIDLLFRILMR